MINTDVQKSKIHRIGLVICVVGLLLAPLRQLTASFASMRAVNTKGRGVLPRSAMPPRRAAPSDTNAKDSSNVELIEGSHGCAFCAGLSDVLWLGLERRTDKGQEMGSNTLVSQAVPPRSTQPRQKICSGTYRVRVLSGGACVFDVTCFACYDTVLRVP